MVLFNEATQNNSKKSYDEYFTEGRVISDTITQLDIGTSQQVTSPKHLIGAHQTRTRADTSDKDKNNAIFDNLDLRKHSVQIDVNDILDSSLENYEENDYFELYRDLKLLFEEFIGEPLLNPFLSYPDMKTKYPIEIIDLRHQLDHITPVKAQLFHQYGVDPENASFYLIFIRRREIEIKPDDNILIEVKVI